MRFRTLAMTFAVLILGSAVVLAQDSGVQGIVDNVFLQDATPGTTQVGHATISGTFRAGQVFVQQGSQVTIPVVGNNVSATGSTFGGSFSSASPQGIGLRGTATATTGTTQGVKGESRSPSGVGIQGVNLSTGLSQSAIGVYGTSLAISGTGVYGTCLNGRGVFGLSSIGQGLSGRSLSGSGVSAVSDSGFGVYAESNSASAVRAANFATTIAAVSGANFSNSGLTRGGEFKVDSPDGFGVYGEAQNVGSGVGVYGKGLSANGYGVASEGRLVAFGGVKNFAIDHPHDPENAYLFHYCSEGKEPLNVYSGSVKTDGHGWATVRLPDYFDEITRDPRIQLTVDDTSEDFVMCKVVGGVVRNAFRLRTSKPATLVYWRVEAVRDDVYARYYGTSDVQPKPQTLKGTLIMPRLYGKPESMSQSARLESKSHASSPRP